MTRIESILVPVDLSEHAGHTLRHASLLARAFAARLEVVHAQPRDLWPPAADPEGDRGAFARGWAQQELQRLVETFCPEDIVTRSRVLSGTAREVILRVAEDERPDLVVMTAGSRRGLSRFLLGSLAESVLRDVDVPVLVLANPHEAGEGFFAG